MRNGKRMGLAIVVVLVAQILIVGGAMAGESSESALVEARAAQEPAEAPEIRRLGKHHSSTDKSVAGGGVILGGLVTAIFAAVFCYIRVTGAREAGLISSSNNRLSPQLEKKLIRWNPPDVNWLKMNVDGSCWLHTSEIGCGGVLRDSNGRWISGFSKNMGYGSSVLAEAWAVKIGLELAKNSSVQNLSLEADSLIVINMIKNGVEIDHPLFPIIAGIRELAAKNWNVTFSHTLREGNRVANLLANLAHKSSGLQVWSNPPSVCINAVQDDVKGTWLPRGFAG
ncbi:putative ribonuclease H-like domain-containing protein [Senna tora]|uniref:Putative ribonuclease H-like domain-containing protein n=1 Tax=Senna tora TaxID=362788 RepID=A0A834WHN2_9FABA|nr:putative ribonuclease H-like domain-containing protein [Senna tora]